VTGRVILVYHQVTASGPEVWGLGGRSNCQDARFTVAKPIREDPEGPWSGMQDRRQDPTLTDPEPQGDREPARRRTALEETSSIVQEYCKHRLEPTGPRDPKTLALNYLKRNG